MQVKKELKLQKMESDSKIRRVQRVHTQTISSLDPGWLKSHPFSFRSQMRNTRG
jgi:hypothetical protein